MISAPNSKLFRHLHRQMFISGLMRSVVNEVIDTRRDNRNLLLLIYFHALMLDLFCVPALISSKN